MTASSKIATSFNVPHTMLSPGLDQLDAMLDAMLDA